MCVCLNSRNWGELGPVPRRFLMSKNKGKKIEAEVKFEEEPGVAQDITEEAVNPFENLGKVRDHSYMYSTHQPRHRAHEHLRNDAR